VHWWPGGWTALQAFDGFWFKNFCPHCLLPLCNKQETNIAPICLSTQVLINDYQQTVKRFKTKKMLGMVRISVETTYCWFQLTAIFIVHSKFKVITGCNCLKCYCLLVGNNFVCKINCTLVLVHTLGKLLSFVFFYFLVFKVAPYSINNIPYTSVRMKN